MQTVINNSIQQQINNWEVNVIKSKIHLKKTSLDSRTFKLRV